MSFDTAAQTYVCDKCGTDLGNGAITICAIVADLDPASPSMVRTLHFCRDRTDTDATGTTTNVKGCTNTLLSSATMVHYNDTHQTTSV